MSWAITYYNDKVRREVMAMPAGVVADYLRLTDAMAIHGADLRMPHSRAMGSGLFELRPKGPEGIGRVFYCTQWAKPLWCCTRLSRKRRRLQTQNCVWPVND